MEILQATNIEGIKCFAPELAQSCPDYPKEAFEKLAAIEDSHFWFRSRNVVIRRLVKKYLSPNGAHRRFLEIGCGSGYVLKMLSTLPGLKCTGGEIISIDGYVRKLWRATCSLGIDDSVDAALC